MPEFTPEIAGKLFGFWPEQSSEEFPKHITAVTGQFGKPSSSKLTEVHSPGIRHLCPENTFRKAELEKLPGDGQYRLIIKTTAAKTIYATGRLA
jgi:hypothetical protein